MAIPLKYATDSQVIPIGQFLDSTDGNTEEPSLTIANTDIKLWKSGATSLASKNSGGATYISNGVYYTTLDATDTNTYGPLVVFVHVSGALACKVECVVMEASAYAALYAASGSGHIEADVRQWLGTACATPTTAGVPEVDPTYLDGDSGALDNLVTAANAYSATRGLAGTALPAAAADAAGGLPISDAGSLDLDALNTAAVRLTAARAQAIDDWIDGGRLDLLLDAIKAITDAIPDSGALSSIAQAATFSGITSLAEWLGLLAGKQVGDSTARTELRATGAGSGTYDETTDSGEALRDRGDAAWTTGGGGSISELLNTHFIIPTSIDLANTATVRLGLMLTNALDDLPSTAEITPGTIDIDRKAIGGTSWSSVVSGAACSEQAGLIYYDEVFDSGSGYVEGDSIRLTFKSQKITVDANDFAITDSNGVSVQTEIRQTMRGTDSAATVGAQMNLADDAITSAKYDQSTAHPIGSADSGSTAIARVGADGDTLESLSDQLDSVATPGDQMTLEDDAITAAKYDQSTAHPVGSADSGSTALARTGADGDTLETLSDQIDGAATPSEVNAEVVDALGVDTIAELSAPPAATPTIKQILMWLFMVNRNKQTATSSQEKIHNDAGTAIGTATISDDLTTTTRGKFG